MSVQLKNPMLSLDDAKEGIREIYTERHVLWLDVWVLYPATSPHLPLPRTLTAVSTLRGPDAMPGEERQSGEALPRRARADWWNIISLVADSASTGPEGILCAVDWIIMRDIEGKQHSQVTDPRGSRRDQWVRSRLHLLSTGP